MIKRNQSKINFLNAMLDFILIAVSAFIAVTLRFEVLNGVVTISYKNGAFLVGTLVYSAVIVALYYIFGLYNSIRFKRAGRDFLKVIILNMVGTLLLMAVFYVARITDFSRWALVLFWVFSSLLVIIKRVIVHFVLKYYRAKGYNQKHFVVIGNGRMAEKFIRNIEDNPFLGITVDGYISKAEKPELGRCLGSYEDLGTLLEQGDYDALIIALEPHEYVWMQYVLAIAAKEGTRVEMIPFYNDEFPARPEIEIVGSTKLINMRATPLDNIGWTIVKRGMDIIGSALLIIITSPIMLAVAIGVKATSPGPVFFKQTRIGKDRKPFTMLKFRSMRTDAAHDQWTTGADSRRTRFGSFIRKFSLDELPQFFNVFAGQMGLVGPRPELPKFVDEFKETVPRYLVRQQCRPGITGWAQINGFRGDTSIAKRVEYDIWYIENWTLGLDIRILFRTLFGGFINEEKL